MKLFKFQYLFLVLQFSVFAQQKESHFLNIVDTTTNQQLQLSSLDSLLQLTKNKNLESFARYTEKYVALAIALQDYEKAIKVAINGCHSINIELGQPKRALKLLTSVENYTSTTTNSYLLGGFYVKKGGIFFNLNQLEKALINYNISIRNYAAKDSIYKADAIFFSGQVHFELSNFLQAIKQYKLAANYYEKLGDKEYMYLTRESVISIYGVTGFEEKTIQERKLLIAKKLKENFTNGLGSNYYNQSLNYKKLGNILEQKNCLLLALKYIQQEKKTSHLLPIVYSQLSKFHTTSNNLIESKKYLDLASKELKGRNEDSYTFLFYYKAKSYYLFKIKEYKQAQTLILKLLSKERTSNRGDFSMEMNMLLSKTYEVLGDNKKAFKYHKIYAKTKDSLRNITKLNALSYYQTLYEAELKEKEISKQQSAIEILAKKNEAKKRLLLFGSVGVLLTALIMYLFIIRLRLTRKKRFKEVYAQKLLLSQEKDRQRISKDLHDGLGQSLLLIKNKVTESDSPEIAVLLNNAIEEMRSISRVIHPFQLTEVGITKALENLIFQIDSNFNETYIFGDIENIDSKLTRNQEMHVYRIMQECLSNIMKHAKADSAKIELKLNEKTISILIKDNGVGFDFSKKYKEVHSLGLKTIKDRIKLLKGTLKIDSALHQGANFHITIPIK